MLDFSEYTELMRKHVDDARRMADILDAVPVFRDRAERMRNCSTLTSGRFCPSCNAFHTERASLCRDRLCPNCGWALARRRAALVARAVSSAENAHAAAVADGSAAPDAFHLFHIVLTVRNCSTKSLNSTLSNMCAALSRFVQYKSFSSVFDGYVRNIEIKRENRGQCVHPHVHMVAVSASPFPIKKKLLSSLWQKALRVDYTPVTWIKEAYGKDASDAIYECVKYAVKTSDWSLLNRNQVEAFASAIKGKHLFSAAGSLRLPEPDALPDPPAICDRCGNNLVKVSLSMRGEVAKPEVSIHAE